MTKNYAEHIVKGSALIFIISIAMNLIGYLIRIFLAHSLTPTEYGLIYSTIAFLGLINIFRGLGMTDTLRKKIPEFLEKNNYVKIKSSIVFTFIIQSLYTVIIISLIFIFIKPITTNILKSYEGTIVLIILALSTLITVAYQVILASLQGLQSVKIYTTIDLLSYLMKFSFIVFLIVPFGVLALPYAYLFTAILMSIITYLIFRIKFSEIVKSKLEIDKNLTKEILYFSTPIMIGYVASSVVSNVDTILISIFRSLEDVALYQVAHPLASLLLLVSGAITIVLLPTVSELWTKNKKETLSNMLGLLTKALFILIIPLALIMIAFPENVISMLFGEQYLGASLTLQILSIGMIIATLSYIFGSSIIGIGKPGLNTKIAFVIMGVNIVFNIILIQIFGIVGAAISLIISNLVGFFLLSYFAKKYIRVYMQWFNLLKIFVGGFLTLLIIFAIKTILITSPWIELIISLVAGFIFYAFFILITKSITKDEIKILTEINLPIPKVFVKFTFKILD
ncbi:MAG: flippase [Candidatus Aenigmatarchaeota archaeon]